MDTSHPSNSRKPGAQPGNRNALKHGFYANRPKVKEHISPSSGNRLQPDIDLYRTILARVAAAISDPDDPPHTLQENIAALNLVTVAVARINGLWRTNARLFSDGSRSLFAALRRLGFTQEQIDTEIFVKSKGKDGGQQGNTNALKYGLYARVITPAADAALETTRDTAIEDELALLRVMLLRASESLTNEPLVKLRQHVRAFNVINQAIKVIATLERSRLLPLTMPASGVMEHYLEDVQRILALPDLPARK